MERNNLILQMDTATSGMYVFDRQTKTAHRLQGRPGSVTTGTLSYPSWVRTYGGYLADKSSIDMQDSSEIPGTVEKINGEYYFIRNVFENITDSSKRVVRPEEYSNLHPRYPIFRLDDGREYFLSYTNNVYASRSPSYSFMKRVDMKNWIGTEMTDSYISYRPMFVSKKSKQVYFLKVNGTTVSDYILGSYDETNMEINITESSWTFESDDDVSILKSYYTQIYPLIDINGVLSDTVIMLYKKSSTIKAYIVREKQNGVLETSSLLNTQINDIITSLSTEDSSNDVKIYPLPDNKVWIVYVNGYNTVVKIDGNSIINMGSMFSTLNPSTCKSGMCDIYSGLAVLQYYDSESSKHRIFEKTNAFKTNVKEPIMDKLDTSNYVKVLINVKDENESVVLEHPFSNSVNTTNDVYASDNLLAFDGCSKFLIKKNTTNTFGFKRSGYISRLFDITTTDTDMNYYLSVETAGDTNMMEAYYMGVFYGSDGMHNVIVSGDMRIFVQSSDYIEINGQSYYFYSLDTMNQYTYSYESNTLIDNYSGVECAPTSLYGTPYNLFAWTQSDSTSILYTLSPTPTRKDTVWYKPDSSSYSNIIKIGNIIDSSDETSSGFKYNDSVLTAQSNDYVSGNFNGDSYNSGIIVSGY